MKQTAASNWNKGLKKIINPYIKSKHPNERNIHILKTYTLSLRILLKASIKY